MKMPKRIDQALKMRTKYAELLWGRMVTVDKFLDEHGIQVEEFDTSTGCEIYCNPRDSEERVRQAIISKEDV